MTLDLSKIEIPEIFLNKGITIEQIKYFRNIFIQILSQNRDIYLVIEECLRRVWIKYDNGGISVGRSVRSIILDKALYNIKNKNYLESKKYVSILLSMYYNKDYINSNNWYDYEVTDFPYASLEETVILTIVGFLLDINEIIDIKNCDIKNFLE